MLNASGAAASMFARVRTLVTLETTSARTTVQKIWQHTELPFQLPHVSVLVIQVVNFRRDHAVEHRLQPHQPKRSRVTSQSLVTQAPK